MRRLTGLGHSIAPQLDLGLRQCLSQVQFLAQLPNYNIDLQHAGYPFSTSHMPDIQAQRIYSTDAKVASESERQTLMAPVNGSLACRFSNVCIQSTTLSKLAWNRKLHSSTSSYQEQSNAGTEIKSGFINPQSVAQGAALSVLQSLYVQKLREELNNLRENQPVILEKDLIDLCKKSNAARGDEQALRLCEALSLTGELIRIPMASGDNVYYLHPQDVNERILKAIPDTAEEYGDMRSEAEQIVKEVADSYQKASRRSYTALLFLLGLGIAQWLYFMYLTFGELTWDVMEPVTYFFNHFFVLLTFTYFIIFQRDFAFNDMHERIRRNFQEQLLRQRGISPQQYERYLADVGRLGRYLKKG